MHVLSCMQLFAYNEHKHTDNSFQVLSAESNFDIRYGSCNSTSIQFE